MVFMPLIVPFAMILLYFAVIAGLGIILGVIALVGCILIAVYEFISDKIHFLIREAKRKNKAKKRR